jgi:ribosomal protein S18 acetylase RimI-like enzyme
LEVATVSVRTEPVEIRTAVTAAEYRAAVELFVEYADSLGVDLCFQQFDKELALFPGEYAPPRGCVLLASCESEWAGVVALRPLDDVTCEMKRLYVRPRFRSHGAGRALAEAVLRVAASIGYRSIRLDTLASMKRARALYAALGFREIPPYRFNPVPGTVYLERALDDLRTD